MHQGESKRFRVEWRWNQVASPETSRERAPRNLRRIAVCINSFFAQMLLTPGWCSGSVSSSGVEGRRFDANVSQSFCTFTKCCFLFCRAPIRLQIGFWGNVRVRKPLKRSPKLHNCSFTLFPCNKWDFLLLWLTATAAYCDKWLTAISGYCDASLPRARSARG